jgi:hypothetical protein
MHGVNNSKISARSLLPGGEVPRVSSLPFISYLMPKFGIHVAVRFQEVKVPRFLENSTGWW